MRVWHVDKTLQDIANDLVVALNALGSFQTTNELKNLKQSLPHSTYKKYKHLINEAETLIKISPGLKFVLFQLLSSTNDLNKKLKILEDFIQAVDTNAKFQFAIFSKPNAFARVRFLSYLNQLLQEYTGKSITEFQEMGNQVLELLSSLTKVLPEVQNATKNK